MRPRLKCKNNKKNYVTTSPKITIMGTGSSSSSGGDIIAAKIDHAQKTGVLNLTKQDIKCNSQIWNTIGSPELSPKIKVLDLSSNPLKSLPAHILTLEHMKSCHLSRCNLQRTPNLASLIELKKMDLDNNDLEETTIGPLPTTLIKLNLSFNHIVVIPGILSTLINLEELDLSNNRLQNVDVIGSLVRLVLLNLDDNQLVELPLSFGCLNKLKKLSIKKNLLIPKAPSRGTQSIPEVLFTETPVETIELHGNNYLPKAEVMAFAGTSTSFVDLIRFIFSSQTVISNSSSSIGVDVFLERRRKSKEKSFQGGAMTDFSLFGLD